MANYRRNYVPGGSYFFTLVTHLRRPIFEAPMARRFLRSAIMDQRRKRPFQIVAICLLPDHLHTVWTLPQDDSDYSLRWKRIKEDFTAQWLAHGGEEGHRSQSRSTKQERAVWQRRFWEHTIEDDRDLKRCVDYIHWNPRKHNLVRRVQDWRWSSFHRFVGRGEYDIEWGGTNPTPKWAEPEWGE